MTKENKGIAYVVKQRFYDIDYCDSIFLNRTEAVNFKNKLNCDSGFTQKEKKEIG